MMMMGPMWIWTVAGILVIILVIVLIAKQMKK